MSTTQAQEREALLNRIRAAMGTHGIQSRTLADEIADALLATPPSAAPAMVAAGWQQRHVDSAEGPSMWVPCSADDARILTGRSDYEVRQVYAQVQGRAGPVEQSAGEQTGPVPARPAPTPAENEDAALLDAIEAANVRTEQWVVAKVKGGFTVWLGPGRHAIRPTLRDAIRAARKDGK